MTKPGFRVADLQCAEQGLRSAQSIRPPGPPACASPACSHWPELSRHQEGRASGESGTEGAWHGPQPREDRARPTDAGARWVRGRQCRGAAETPARILSVAVLGIGPGARVVNLPPTQAGPGGRDLHTGSVGPRR